MDFVKTKWRELLTVFIGLFIVVGRVIIPTKYEVTTTVVLIEISIEILVLVCAILLNKEKVKKIREDIKQDSVKNIIKRSLLFLCVLPIMIIATSLFEAIGLNPIVLKSIMEKFQGGFIIGAIVSIVLIGPLAEELVFRLAFRKLISNKVLYVIISSLAFAFIHDWIYCSVGIAAYFVVGVFLSLMYLKFDKLHYNIFGHYLVNVITFIITLTTAGMVK